MDAPKQRHGCLTLTLMVYLFVCGFVAIALTVKSDLFREKYPTITEPLLWALTTMAVLNILCLLALYYWRRWGFYGFAIINSLVFSLNLYTTRDVIEAVPSLVGIAILYGVLHIGGEKSGWAQMSATSGDR